MRLYYFKAKWQRNHFNTLKAYLPTGCAQVIGHTAKLHLFPEDSSLLNVATPASDSDAAASIQPTDFTAELKHVENRMNPFHKNSINRVNTYSEILLRPLNSFLT